MQGMTNESESENEVARVAKAFEANGIAISGVQARKFPGETIFVVEVLDDGFEDALRFVSSYDFGIADGFVTVKRALSTSDPKLNSRVSSLADAKVSALIELLNARSRTSEQQPSLKYIRGATEQLRVAVSRRHHLIFGRRGVGKTALMLEVRRQVETSGALTLWVNVQSMRSLSPEHAFLSVATRVCEVVEHYFSSWKAAAQSAAMAREARGRTLDLIKEMQPTAHMLGLLINDIQVLLNRFGTESSRDLFIFVDEIHYLGMPGQPTFLDMLHSISRDNPVWLKIAGIKHQTRWFMDNPPIGLQTTHDASIINLDITLENPSRAKNFLVSILQTYAAEAQISATSSVISNAALERLVIASGAVPRDFLLLCANSIQVARERPKAKTAGVQDVNAAAGISAKTKLQELEDDAASSFGSAKARIDCLGVIRIFLLNESAATYFRVEFHDKETHALEYALLQSLMDLRLIHLINASISDEHQAGKRYEVYALDLSEFSGSRLKYNLRTLDFSQGFLVLKHTGTVEAPKVGNSPNKLLGILRRGPTFSLQKLSRLVNSGTDATSP
jgi:hypothetical protein